MLIRSKEDVSRYPSPRAIALLGAVAVAFMLAFVSVSPTVAQAANGCGPAGTTKPNIPAVLLPALGPLAAYGVAIDLAPVYIKTANLVPDSGPFFNFRTACNAHDVCYGTWASIKDTCDTRFLTAMRSNCRSYAGAAGTACSGLADTYYEAVHIRGANAWLGAQLGTGLHRRLLIVATGPPSSTTTPFTKFTFAVSNGVALSEFCTFDGALQACSPAATYVATKGTHTATFQVRNYSGTVTKTFKWTIH